MSGGQPISLILDDGMLVVDLLRSIGIFDTNDLLQSAAAAKTRRALARQILHWVSAANLTQIKGVGRLYARLLQECCVRSTLELSYRSSQHLAAELREVNSRLRLVVTPPPEQFVARWIEDAKELSVHITHR